MYRIPVQFRKQLNTGISKGQCAQLPLLLPSLPLESRGKYCGTSQGIPSLPRSTYPRAFFPTSLVSHLIPGMQEEGLTGGKGSLEAVDWLLESPPSLS